MLQSTSMLKLSGLAAIATVMGSLAALEIEPVRAGTLPSFDLPSPQLVAYENMCEEDELLAGDEVTIEGETYTLEEDEDGLFVEYMLVDEEGEDTGDGVGTYSLASFDEDCETASFEQVDGTDSIIGADVD